MKKILILLPVVLAIVAALALAGVIQIPGISPKKAKANAASLYAQKEGKPVAKAPALAPPPTALQPSSTQPKKVVEVQNDPVQGAEALAAIWDEVPTKKLEQIVKDWRDPDLAKVLKHMDTSKVAKLLSSLAEGEPKRASKLSRVLQIENSLVADKS